MPVVQEPAEPFGRPRDRVGRGNTGDVEAGGTDLGQDKGPGLSRV